MRKITSTLTFAFALATGAGAAHAGILSHVQIKDLTGFLLADQTYNDGSTLRMLVGGFRSRVQNNPTGGRPVQLTGYINYFISRCSADGIVCNTEMGFGDIPSSAVSGGSRNERIYVDVSRVSGFVNRTCTTNYAIPETNCYPATGGIIDVSWKAGAKAAVSKQAGSTTYEVPGARVTITGSNTFVVAPATGLVLGTPVPYDPNSYIQSFKNGYITIESK
ncbi:MAG: hypothetical protein ABIW76_06925 [Fibrobacteria bacterium]